MNTLHLGGFGFRNQIRLYVLKPDVRARDGVLNAKHKD